MAKKTKVATLKKKRTKKKPLCWVDKKGNVRHRKGGRKKGKGSILEKKVVGKDLLKARKAGKIILFLRGKVGKTLSVWKVKNGLKNKKKRKMKKRKARGRKRRGRPRKVGRPRLSARKRKSSRCPKTRKAPTVRSAKACIRRGKGRSIAKRKVFNQAVRKLKRSAAGRKWLRENKVKMAKTRKSRKKARRRKKSRRKGRKKARRRGRRR